jgi:hypothetical protein
MSFDLRLWFASLLALIAASFAPHPTSWAIVGLFLVSDRCFRERIGRLVSPKRDDRETLIDPPKDGEGYPLILMSDNTEDGTK